MNDSAIGVVIVVNQDVSQAGAVRELFCKLSRFQAIFLEFEELAEIVDDELQLSLHELTANHGAAP